MKDYIENIIKTGLANGLTLEQLMSNPDAAAKAYLESQLKAIDQAGNDLLADLSNENQ
jgi:Tfp pilus assembly protein PilO